ncbi:hypothetical protein Tco_1303285 [Tanacetum coccineum]
MVVQDQAEIGEGSANPTDPHHTPTFIQPSTSKPEKKQKPRKPKIKVTQIPQSSGPTKHVADEDVYKELDDSLVKVTTTASSLEAKQDSGNIAKTQSKATPNESSSLGTTYEELREFTSEYYIPSALHPVVPAASASIDMRIPSGEGSMSRDERPPPGSYSMEDAELINENRIPINAYSEAFLCHMGISRNYFQSPEEVPTFIGDDGREMDLFSVVHLSKPKQVTEGVRPLRDGEEPLLESTAGRTMELVLEQPEVESTDVLAPTPLRSVPSATVEPPRPDATSVGSSEDADVAEVDSGLKRKRATGDDGAGPSKRVRHVSLGLSTSTEEETPDASPTLAAKEVTETPPPNVEATSDSSAPVTHAAQSPPQTGPKAFEGMPVDQLMEEFDMVTASKPRSSAHLRARFSIESSQVYIRLKKKEILLLKTQLADAQAEAESSRSYAQNLAEEKMALLVKVEQERADAAEYKASCHWAVKYLEGGKNNHFAGLDEFRQRGGLIALGWLAAMSTLESQEVKQSFGDVVKFALARGKAEAVECNFMKEGDSVEGILEARLIRLAKKKGVKCNEKYYAVGAGATSPVRMDCPHVWRLCYLMNRNSWGSLRGWRCSNTKLAGS